MMPILYLRWKNGDVLCDCGNKSINFGLGINKDRFIIRNGLPASIPALAQELGRAGRDGKYSEAHIFYCDEDIHHVGFWNGDHACRNRIFSYQLITESTHQLLTQELAFCRTKGDET